MEMPRELQEYIMTELGKSPEQRLSEYYHPGSSGQNWIPEAGVIVKGDLTYTNADGTTVAYPLHKRSGE